ncbi:MAG: glycosyltransferase [Cyanosarcina radialis HA8281-LM2]|jgi:cellulose synthase (UDP-forming)|nr:glycosyltransferase [Cyanosarcina radialis HA8281-LM2]
MTASNFDNNRIKPFASARINSPQTATLVMLGFMGFSAVIVTAWFGGEGRISRIFQNLQLLQENPPMWLEVPMVAGEYLTIPTVLLMLIVLAVMQISPQPRRWSRWIVVGLLLILTGRYLLWRSLSTLNLTDPLNGVFSVGLFSLEMLILVSSTIQLVFMLNTKDRRREADRLSVDVINGNFTPLVDILIPTYNEPNFILKRTVIGCQALEYSHKKVYLLDDTRRLEVKQLAEELGCEYLTRPDNLYAKAGNLNHAIDRTQGDLIVVFDADFVPTKNFLTRTIGFFQDSKVALVQTPQSFYNADPIARNLGLDNVLTPEEEVFYRQIQPLRDAAGSVICSGTSFVVCRRALEEAGGFVTDSLSEDYFTGVRLSARGYRLVYLDEKLSAGLAAENISAHATQRLRWARGTLQAFFIDANPLTIKGLNFWQRLAHSEGLLHWFASISRLGFLLMPLAYSFLGVIPVRATPMELMYFFLPYYIVNLTTFSWLNYRSRSALLSDVYSLILTFPLALTTIQVMFNPFAKGFKVTPKGTRSDRYFFNWNLACPLILIFVLSAISLWRNWGMCMLQTHGGLDNPLEVAARLKGLSLGCLWSGYNLIVIWVALLILLDVPKLDVNEWFDLRRTVRFNVGDRAFWGSTTMISEAGAEIAITQGGLPTISPGDYLPVSLTIMEEKLKLTASINWMGFREGFSIVRVQFEEVQLPQHRRLVEMLFCRPGQWKSRCSPGELRSLFILFQTLFRPRVLFNRRVDILPIAVAQI